MTRWTMYAEDPECCDDQGYILLSEGAQLDPDAEFDGVLDPGKDGFYIRDLSTATRAAQNLIRDQNAQVVTLHWI